MKERKWGIFWSDGTALRSLEVLRHSREEDKEHHGDDDMERRLCGGTTCQPV